ncbi:MAG TPA: tRNA lysidine(34) synthetase TilS [Candidatus Didemnitutus sp.]|jgi:tRNA(Ile)-lysidine synthase
MTDWRSCAEHLARAIPAGDLHPETRAHMRSRIEKGPWGVAVSGGADSVTLLLLLWAHFPADRRRLVVLHFDHRLRGADSRADARFCRALASALGLRYREGAWTKRPREISEADARAARMKFFARELARRKSRTLWLAHQRDDVAESLLMRLARGSGAGGLAAPRPVQKIGGRWHLRPLLDLGKDRIVAELALADGSWREDESNRSPAFFRNRVRGTVIPAWTKAAGRDAVAGAARSRQMLQEDDDALEFWLDRIKPLRGRTLELTRLRGGPVALWRRALHRWLLTVRPDTDLSRRGFDALLEAVRRGKDTRFSLGTNGFAVVAGGRLLFKKR